MSFLTDQSEDRDLQRIALTACLMVCEYEGELIAHPTDCEVDAEAAATVWLLAQAGVPLADVGPYLRAERMAS